ncbi:histidinol dehydrogenase [Desulfovibrio sulfodismutans]|uniref:Histidinol dehydrogenase n=1 Tax=Desulfolutivibrio sulfodismutans TaxID=63561 RepID=A0A7K3NHD7_9BACT|nr:histidinol dehydrogenase [Desulfolutivibrio sulfodismutans]NDY55616.1 histidinol dehydrogenase [Desulfolutivibrio sulfodismutans]QLA11682.1 histidinol dehydrogenase [Desulfolutivibrio sulfodismutans DSM 3696]
MPCPLFVCNSPDAFGPVLDRLAARNEPPHGEIAERTAAILADVAARGDAALVDYTRRFDCPEFTEAMIRVPEADIAAAADAVSADDLAIIAEAADNIRRFHEAQVQRSWWMTQPDGTLLGRMVTPVDRAGLYVPGGVGGETPLISSLLMNAIPAQVAGVARIAVVSPPRKDGSLNPNILAAAHVLGLAEVYRVGSAWAIAALAHGTRTIAPADVLAGPGNIYVTTAKRLLVGTVGIDMIAGPSEIVILADDTANPDWLAADMLSQAEHDPLAASVCLTTSEPVAQAVRRALEAQLAALPRSDIAARSLADFGLVAAVADLDMGARLVNRMAPEHLELAVADPFALLGKIRHAGAIFMGHMSAEPVGDYFAGPNHVLPTMGTARFSSGLSVAAFCKESSVISASPEFVRKHGAKIARLARLEGLEAHARSMECRFVK